MTWEHPLKALLEEKALLYNHPAFIETDPVQVPHLYTLKEDREIAGFLTATLAWGSRTAIISSALKLMGLLGNRPFAFLQEASPTEFLAVTRFVHRTFNGEDTLFFLESLKNIYQNHGGLEEAFACGYRSGGTVFSSLVRFREIFLTLPCFPRSCRHVADVQSGSAAKRLNLFLRWMIRNDSSGVDLGIWKGIPPSALMIPLDVHTGNTARNWGLLTRKQNDWKAVEELTALLRLFDPEDPVKYDYALFGTGALGGFPPGKCPGANRYLHGDPLTGG